MKVYFQSTGFLLSLALLFAPTAVAERKLGACPDFAGMWTCEMYVNRSEDREPVSETMRVTQKNVSSTKVAYDIGGSKFEAMWDTESIVPYNKKDPEAVEVKVRCFDERTLFFWYDREGIPYQQTIRRESPERLVSDTIRLRPEYGSNNVITRICQPAKWP